MTRSNPHDHHHREAIICRLASQEAKSLDDSELDRCLLPCVLGAWCAQAARRLRADGLIPWPLRLLTEEEKAVSYKAEFAAELVRLGGPPGWNLEQRQFADRQRETGVPPARAAVKFMEWIA